MSPVRVPLRFRFRSPVILALLLAALAGCAPAQRPAQNPQQRALYAGLWMQLSAEYRALCYQTYHFATQRLQAALPALPPGARPPAVVLDLDETVLDNSGYQTFLARTAQESTEDLWIRWEKEHPEEVRLLAGAKEFLDYCKGAGISVFFISNRNEESLAPTMKALAAAGLDPASFEGRVLLRPASGHADKTPRREAVAARHTILMLMGDNLRDLSEELAFPAGSEAGEQAAREAIAARLAAVDARRDHFGTEWVVFPNPVYGEWTKPLRRNPESFLRETRMR